MSNMLVMTPNGQRDADSIEHAVLVREGFAGLAILLPPLWLLWHRAYGAALVVFLLEVTIASLASLQGWPLGALFLNSLLSFYVALDGNAWVRNAMENRGFEVIDVLPTGSRAEAEDMLDLLVDKPESIATFGHQSLVQTPSSRTVMQSVAPSSSSADAMIFSSRG